jgi:ubiquinone/menaquinone biosynthesis C-methylase UbiE
MTLRWTFLAPTYDRQMARVERAGLASLRQDLLAGAAGDVLEIGAGTGINLPHYGPAVSTLTLTEPEPPMLQRLQRKVDERGMHATVLRAPAEDLPFESDSFDVAVSTLVLCGVGDQPRTLRELHRVLKPGGTLLFLEHVRSDDAHLARLQDRMNGVNRFVVGCECNRPTLSSIAANGFAVIDVTHTTAQKLPRFVRPLVVGSACAVPGTAFSPIATTEPEGATNAQGVEDDRVEREELRRR